MPRLALAATLSARPAAGVSERVVRARASPWSAAVLAPLAELAGFALEASEAAPTPTPTTHPHNDVTTEVDATDRHR